MRREPPEPLLLEGILVILLSVASLFVPPRAAMPDAVAAEHSVVAAAGD